MSSNLGADRTGPESFAFDAENRAKADRIIARYPVGRQASGVMALLDLAQRQSGGWLPRAAMDHVASCLGMAQIRVYEVATFYSMFNLRPIGRHHVRICTTTPCELRGCKDLLRVCCDTLGINLGETTPDGLITLAEVECLGACVNAPIVWIGDDYYEDIDADSMRRILDALRRGATPKPGPQIVRHRSAPATGLTSLTGESKL